MNLAPLEPEDAELARQWRNERLDALRTPYPLTYEDQQRWYSNREGRWWAVKDNSTIGYGGIQHIQWENRLGELSLLMRPESDWGRGEALDLILIEAFSALGLFTVYAEVYLCNHDIEWWAAAAGLRGASRVILPNRKFYQGTWWDSLYFSFDGRAYEIAGDKCRRQDSATEVGADCT
jgi:RimJ/RimL family protein N-acetyltransferase